MAEPKNRNAVMELYRHTDKIALFSYAAAQNNIPSSPFALEQMFFHIFCKSGVFFKVFFIENH